MRTVMRKNYNVNIVVAVTENDAIGKDNKLLFHLKEDMRNFKHLTNGNVVIMGRKTFESIGKPLENRVNVIISRVKHEDKDNVKWVESLEEAVKYAKVFLKEIFIIGGASIYKEALEKDIANRIYLTRIKKTVENADTFFPRLDYFNEWEVSNVESYKEGLIEYDICEIRKRTKDFRENIW